MELTWKTASGIPPLGARAAVDGGRGFASDGPARVTPKSTDPVAILSELVAFRTDVDEGHERPLADRLAELLRERGAGDVTVADVPRALH